MGKYFLIPVWDFQKFKVRRVHTKTVLVLAYCQRDVDGWWACNILAQYPSFKNIITLIRGLQEKNDTLHKKV